MKKKSRKERRPAGKSPKNQRQEGTLNQTTMDIAERYEPTPDERRAQEAFLARRKTPRVKVSVLESQQKGVMVDWSLDHPHQNFGHYLLTEALGTSEFDFYTGMMTQLLKAASKIKGPCRKRVDRLPVSRGAWRRTQRQSQRYVSSWAFHERRRGGTANAARAAATI